MKMQLAGIWKRNIHSKLENMMRGKFLNTLQKLCYYESYSNRIKIYLKRPRERGMRKEVEKERKLVERGNAGERKKMCGLRE